MIDDSVTGEPLVLNRELEGPVGMRVTAMSQPGGFAVLLRGAPSEPVAWFLVSICYRLQDGDAPRFITRPMLPPEHQGPFGYGSAIFPINTNDVFSVFVSPQRVTGDLGPAFAFFAQRGQRLPATVIGLG